MKRAGRWNARGISLPAIVVSLCAVGAGVALVGDGGAVAAAPEASATPPGQTRGLAAADPSRKPRYIGAAGCAAAMCHGGGGVVAGELTPLGSEYTYWLSRDPHARAYAVLLEPASVGIVRNLRGSPLYADLPEASEAALCLTCHSISPGSTEGEPNPHGLQGGVSCEACHGPAEHWLEPHKRADWPGLPAEAKQALGFRNTEDLVSRIQLCSECHVGGERGDVNHDLIAAGHPRMNFEFAAYHTNLPPHWDVAAERRKIVGDTAGSASEREAEYEARLWAIGQVVVARESLELLRLRAGRGTAGQLTQPVWPEFGELNCFDCHHRLETKSWRQDREYANRPPGAAAWGTWAYSMLPLLSAETGGPDLAAPDSPFGKLEREMIRPYPDQEEVRQLAALVIHELDEWTAGLNGRTDWGERVRPSLVRLTGEGQRLARRDWDGAAQTYLGLAALIKASSGAQGGDTEGPMLHGDLDTIREALRLGGEKIANDASSPADYADRLETILSELSRLQAKLSPTR